MHGGYNALNFFLLILCLMVGTASLPHVLMRYFTTPSVREARKSPWAWSLLFIFILYFTAPAYAAFAKWTMLDLVASGLARRQHRRESGMDDALGGGRQRTGADLRQGCHRHSRHRRGLC